MNKKEIIIFTDGASRGNPGPGGFGAVIVIDEKVFEIGGREENTTNNRMELTAAIEALEFLSSYKLKTNDYKIIIYTDSSYLINGITKWIYSWEKRNWITKNKEPVLNKDLWEQILELVRNKKIEWNYVGGHRGITGNERADEISTQFADLPAQAGGRKPDLFSSLISKYKINIFEMNGADSTKKKKTNSKTKAYSYLSMVDKVIKIDDSWEECEKRVKGKSGAKFKKSFSAEDEEEIIKNWQNF